MTKISASVQVAIGSAAICQTASISMRTTNTSNDRSKPKTATTSSSHRFNSSQSIQQHPNYQNAILFLLPLLLMILKETSALPPIIKIGEFVVVVVVSYTICIFLFDSCWLLNRIILIWDSNGNDRIESMREIGAIKPFDNNNRRPTVINRQFHIFYLFFHLW